MSRGSKLCKREKNKWQRELEQYTKDKNDEQLDRERDLYDDLYDALYEVEYARNLEDNWDGDWDNYDEDYSYDYEDDWYIEEFDDWHLDSRTYAESFTPGSHVQNGKDVYLVLTTKQFANLRTGEVVCWLAHAALIWGS